ncbi:hydrogen peroxide-inducible genes activator [Glaciecola sp. MH2013]|uniref:hydrogen peroxide-inducible genes activator n=1 Tax=Glaciecola sp. MH2013 TaxID=2785524 RepID=UPI00189DB473|nr:hydrogen peroxide-inducible genes activator [Glaciecola sp. MH2013]MBF7072022.1 hydrogen peroxide-inducible genes activator [Glaciecola sp. MH2013]
MKLPNLKHLHYLTVLHKEQHFHRAADKCNVSQSTLSAAVQNLEDSIGQQLLEREHKNFVFTDFGEALVNKSQYLLRQTHEWIEFAESAGDWKSGTLRIGVIPTIAPFLFEGMIRSISEALPDIKLQLHEDTTDNLLARLEDGELNLLVLALPMQTPGCKQLVIGRDPFHLIAHEDSTQDISVAPAVDTLPKDSIFLLQKEHCLTEHAVSACGLQHKEQISSLTANSLHTLVSLVNSGMGYTFLPEMALNKNILAGSDVVSLPAEDGAYRELGLVWRNGTTRVQLFRYLAKLLSKLTPEPADID